MLEFLIKLNCTRLINEKLFKKKGDKLYVKWKDYDNYFNGWVDKNDECKWMFS